MNSSFFAIQFADEGHVTTAKSGQRVEVDDRVIGTEVQIAQEGIRVHQLQVIILTDREGRALIDDLVGPVPGYVPQPAILQDLRDHVSPEHLVVGPRFHTPD